MRTVGREGIIEAALSVLASHGALGMTMRTIADAAGVTEAAIYRHFRSKRHLIDELFVRCADLLFGHLFTAQEGLADPAERLVALALAFFDFSIAHPREYRLIASVHLHQLQIGHVQHERLPKRLFVEAAHELLGEGTSAEEAEALAGAIIGAVMGVLLMLDVGAVTDLALARRQVAQVAWCLAHRSGHLAQRP
ncbi:MAG: TetR/AcrR family transcriptional regulator [Armatimonadetes bacterium]|nr:TetR/AcrR family transcriptional regulator [Armatimonadota bacterium]